MSAREDILARIRARQGKAPVATAAEREAVRANIAAHAPGPRPRAGPDPVACFRDQALRLSSTVDVVDARAVPVAVARYLDGAGLPRTAVSWPGLMQLDWAGAGMTVAARPARDGDLVGITGAFCAIAETGTLMMLSGPATPAAASLLPETHVAVLPVARLVDGMEDAWRLLRDEVGEPPRAVNFISGPSRTADIEQTVTLGAHGPYRVHVILVQP